MNVLARWIAGTAILRRRRTFARLLAARTLTALGGSVYRFAVIWLVYIRTGSALYLGGTAVAMAVASLLAPFFGALTDRLPKRSVLVATDTGAAVFSLALAGLALPAHLAITPAYFCAFAIASLSMLDWTAFNASIPLTVAPEELSAANGVWSAGMTLIQMLGPAVAGGVVAAVGPAVTLAAAAVVLGCAATVVSGVRLPGAAAEAADPAAGKAAAGQPQSQPATGSPRGGRRPGVLAEVREGIRYVLGESILIRLTALITALNLAYSATDPMVLWLLQRRLHLSPAAIGLVFAAQAAGTLVASTSFASLGRRFDRGTGALIGGCAFGMGLEIWAAAINPGLAVLAGAVVGFSMALVNLNLLTLRQELVPPALLGRTLGTTAMLGRLVMIVGPTVGALMVAGPGLVVLFSAAGAMTLVISGGLGLGLRAETLARTGVQKREAPAAGDG